MGEGAGSEAPSLLSYTLRYVSLTELGTLWPVWVARADAPAASLSFFKFWKRQTALMAKFNILFRSDYNINPPSAQHGIIYDCYFYSVWEANKPLHSCFCWFFLCDLSTILISGEVWGRLITCRCSVRLPFVQESEKSVRLINGWFEQDVRASCSRFQPKPSAWRSRGVQCGSCAVLQWARRSSSGFLDRTSLQVHSKGTSGPGQGRLLSRARALSRSLPLSLFLCQVVDHRLLFTLKGGWE